MSSIPHNPLVPIELANQIGDFSDMIPVYNGSAGNGNPYTVPYAKLVAVSKRTDTRVNMLEQQLQAGAQTATEIGEGFQTLNAYTALKSAGNAYTINTGQSRSTVKNGSWFLINWAEPNDGQAPPTLQIDQSVPRPIVTRGGNAVLEQTLRDTVLINYVDDAFVIPNDTTKIIDDISVDVAPSGSANFQTLAEAIAEIERYYTTVGEYSITINLSNHVHPHEPLIFSNPSIKFKLKGGGRAATRILNQSGTWALYAINQRLSVEGMTLENGGLISASGGIVTADDLLVKNAPYAGIYASFGQLSASNNVEVTECATGFMATGGGKLEADSTYAHHNTNQNYRAVYNSHLSAISSRSEHSKYGYQADSHSVIYARNATVKNNTAIGTTAYNGAYVYAPQQVISGNSVNYSPSPNQSVNGAFIRV